jgi:thioredoxin reductase
MAAAAHLLARGQTPIVFEAGAHVGASVRAWGHVRMFSPWQYVVDTQAVRLLEKHGWAMPPADELPTGDDLFARYLAPLAALPEIAPHLHTGARVTTITRRHIDRMKDAGRTDAPFTLYVTYADGREAVFEARAIIDASGTWTQPNPLGADGAPAPGERGAAARIAYGIPDVIGRDRARYAGKRVLVAGSGHSAVNVLLNLEELAADAPGTQITWVMRGDNLARVYGGGEDDALSARGALGTRIRQAVERGTMRIVAPFRACQVRLTDSGVEVTGDTPGGLLTLSADEVITATGARPDTSLLRELRVDLDPSLEAARGIAAMIDPNIHSCGTVPPHGEAELRQPERDVYIVGMKSYGRAPTFLLLTGYEQVRSVVAALAGDWEAASQVELVLPETGVCSSDGIGGACCVPAGKAAAPAVITLDGILTL